MRKLKVITASPGLSGAGLIFDYLLSRKDFVSPFKKIPDGDQQTEFRFISEGILLKKYISSGNKLILNVELSNCLKFSI